MTPERIIERGEYAKQLLDNEILQDSFRIIERDISAAWANTPIRDKEGQHELLLMRKMLDKFKGVLLEVINDGEIEKNKLQTPKLKRTLERFGVF